MSGCHPPSLRLGPGALALPRAGFPPQGALRCRGVPGGLGGCCSFPLSVLCLPKREQGYGAAPPPRLALLGLPLPPSATVLGLARYWRPCRTIPHTRARYCRGGLGVHPRRVGHFPPRGFPRLYPLPPRHCASCRISCRHVGIPPLSWWRSCGGAGRCPRQGHLAHRHGRRQLSVQRPIR